MDEMTFLEPVQVGHVEFRRMREAEIRRSHRLAEKQEIDSARGLG